MNALPVYSAVPYKKIKKGYRSLVLCVLFISWESWSKTHSHALISTCPTHVCLTLINCYCYCYCYQRRLKDHFYIEYCIQVKVKWIYFKKENPVSQPKYQFEVIIIIQSSSSSSSFSLENPFLLFLLLLFCNSYSIWISIDFLLVWLRHFSFFCCSCRIYAVGSYCCVIYLNSRHTQTLKEKWRDMGNLRFNSLGSSSNQQALVWA